MREPSPSSLWLPLPIATLLSRASLMTVSVLLRFPYYLLKEAEELSAIVIIMSGSHDRNNILRETLI